MFWGSLRVSGLGGESCSLLPLRLRRSGFLTRAETQAFKGLWFRVEGLWLTV